MARIPPGVTAQLDQHMAEGQEALNNVLSEMRTYAKDDGDHMALYRVITWVRQQHGSIAIEGLLAAALFRLAKENK